MSKLISNSNVINTSIEKAKNNMLNYIKESDIFKNIEIVQDNNGYIISADSKIGIEGYNACFKIRLISQGDKNTKVDIQTIS